MSRLATVVICLGLGSLLPPLCGLVTTWWCERYFLPRIAGED